MSKQSRRSVPRNAPPPQVICTLYMLIYTKDKSAIDALGPIRRRRFAALPQLRKLLLWMSSRPQLSYAHALAALVEADGEAAPPAVCDAVATLDARRAPAAASPVGASLEDTAGAAPVRAVPSFRVATDASPAAPLDNVARAPSGRGAAAAVSAALAPAVTSAQSDAVVMRDARNLSAASAPQQLDVLDALDDDGLEEALSTEELSADEQAALEVFRPYVNTRAPDAFARACSLACSRADRERYAALPERIEFGARMGQWLDAALVADSLSEPGHPVTEADVRGGAARPIRPFARDDRRHRAHERPSSATPRHAGPQSRCAPAFPGR